MPFHLLPAQALVWLIWPWMRTFRSDSEKASLIFVTDRLSYLPLMLLSPLDLFGFVGFMYIWWLTCGQPQDCLQCHAAGALYTLLATRLFV